MKAFIRVSAQNQIVEMAEVPVPEISDDEVLVEVRAFGVGIHDRYFIPQNASFPYVIGTEAAGIVRKTGGKVSQYKTGEKVILSSVLQPKGGCWAEYAVVPENALVPMPDDLDFVVAATLPVAGKTALESVRALDLESGETLFIAGASGAIGTLFIQMAAQREIRVIASASRKNHEYILSLGAEKAVDYNDPDWKNKVLRWKPGGVDAALAIQPGTIKDCVDVVRDGGKAVTVSGDPIKTERDVEVFQFEHHEDTRDTFIELIADAAGGRIKAVIERVYPFERALDALEKTETRHARGKLAVTLDDEAPS